MTVSETIGREAVFLGASVLVGAGLFFLYDVLRIFRRLVPHGTVWVGVEDFFYWLICTGAVFVLINQKNDGMVRGFALFGVGLGMLLYFLLFSGLVVRLNVFVLRKITGFFQKIFRAVSSPFVRIGKKYGRFFRKELKKIFRAVKMGLGKR